MNSHITNPLIDIENIIIETPRCIIKTFYIEGMDFVDLTEAFCGANENNYVSPFLPTVEQERNYIIESIEARHQGKNLSFFVFDNDDHLIGGIGINDLDDYAPNLGLWIRKECQGKGYGTEMYEYFLEWVRKNTDFKVLKHATNPENTGSIRLAEHFNGKLQDELTDIGHLKYYIHL